MATTQATQDFVPIREVRSGTVILKDGSLRAIVMTSSINFALKSEGEQEALLAQFQNFLNSLEFSIQISVQSRRLDIRPYIAVLENRFREQVGEIIKIQTREYIEFIKNFTESSEIMTKTFFIVVPYGASAIRKQAGGLASILPFGQSSPKTTRAEDLNEALTQLDQRVSVVDQGLARLGIRTIRLGTEETIELFYKIFNPGELDKPIPLQ